jgi:hypothetical protein
MGALSSESPLQRLHMMKQKPSTEGGREALRPGSHVMRKPREDYVGNLTSCSFGRLSFFIATWYPALASTTQPRPNTCTRFSFFFVLFLFPLSPFSPAHLPPPTEKPLISPSLYSISTEPRLLLFSYIPLTLVSLFFFRDRS